MTPHRESRQPIPASGFCHPNDFDHDIGACRQGRPSRGGELLAQLRRRHDAARRLPPLPNSGRRDPLTARERADCQPRP